VLRTLTRVKVREGPKLESEAAHARLDDLWRCHAAQVLAYARRRSAEDVARDVLAETFVVAWRRIDAVPSGDGAIAWLYAVARNILRNHRRSELRRESLLRRIEPARPGGDPAEQVDGAADAIRGALGELAEADREVLMLFGLEGLDAAGAAAVLGCSPGTARVRLHRARRRLGAVLERRQRVDGMRLAIAGDA